MQGWQLQQSFPKKLRLNNKHVKTFQVSVKMSGRNSCEDPTLTYSTRNLTVKVNPQKGLEVLVCYLPHREGLLGGLGQEAQEDADGVLGWDCKEMDVAATRQAKQAPAA